MTPFFENILSIFFLEFFVKNVSKFVFPFVFASFLRFFNKTHFGYLGQK